jgi:hypothetical protein
LFEAEGRQREHHGARVVVIPDCDPRAIKQEYADVLHTCHWWFDVGHLASDNDPKNRPIQPDEY